MFQSLSGKKTYLVALAWIAYGFLHSKGIVGEIPNADSLFAALGLGTLRAGVDKAAKTGGAA